MNDIIIKIDTKTAKAYCEYNKIGVQHANLQNKLIFEMSEKINGSAWLEYEINGTKNYAEMEDTENGYQIDIKSCLLVSNNVNVDLKITESEDAEGIPIFISTIVELDVYDSINATTEEPEYYPDWKTVADSKIAEMNQLKEDVNEAITKTNNLNIDASKSGKVATVTLTKKDATTKTVTLSDGTNLMFNWNGTKLGIKTDEEQEYTYVDLIGPQGIQGETGVTPNLTIGTVITGNASSATIIGTPENPVLNLVLEKGDTGETGATGNGISSIEKIGTQDNVDTYTIYYTNGTTSTFTVTNSTVTNQEFQQLQADVEYYKKYSNALITNTNTGTSLSINDTAECPMEIGLNDNTSQISYTGRNLANFETIDYRVENDATVSRSGQEYTITCDANNRWGSCRFSVYNLGLKLNTTYTFSALIKSTTSSTGSYVYVYSGATSTGTSFSGNKASAGNRVSVTFTTPSSWGSSSYQVGLLPTEAGATTVFTNVMIEESSTMGEYEPYVGGQPSPSPSYPQTIHVVSGNNTIKVSNKNIWGGFNKAYSGTTYEVDFTINTDGSIYVNGTANGTSVSGNVANLYKNGIYVTLPSGTYTASKNSTNVQLQVYNSNSTSLLTIQNSSTSGTFTLNEEMDVIVRVRVSNGTTINETVNIQLEKNSTKTEYEQHKDIKYPINLPIENLFDKSTATYKNGYYKNNDGTETPSIGGTSGYLTSYVEVKPNTQYTINGVGILRNYYYDNSKNWISRTTSGITRPYTFTTPNNCHYIQFQYDTATYDADTVQIELGSNASQYWAYGTTPIELCKIGNYEDTIFQNIPDNPLYKSTLTEGSWYVMKNTGKVVLDGTESWRFSSSVTTPENRSVIRYSQSLYNLSNYFSNYFIKGSTTANRLTTSGSSPSTYLSLADTISGIVDTDTDNEKLAKLVSWLENHNTIVYYSQATPTYTEITDSTLITQLNNISKALSYKPQTNITQVNNDLPFNLSVSTIYDSNALLTRVETLESEV